MYFIFMLERCAAQPVAAQVLYARGEREGSGVDRRRGGVPQAEAPEGVLSGVRVRFWGQLWEHFPENTRVTRTYLWSLYISAPNPYLSIYLSPDYHHYISTSIFDWWEIVSHHNHDSFSFDFDKSVVLCPSRPSIYLYYIHMSLRWPLNLLKSGPSAETAPTINLLTLSIRFCTRKTTWTHNLTPHRVQHTPLIWVIWSCLTNLCHPSIYYITFQPVFWKLDTATHYWPHISIYWVRPFKGSVDFSSPKSMKFASCHENYNYSGFHKLLQ